MFRKIIAIALLLMLMSNVSYGINLFGQADTRLGAYTGPVGGTEQDDNVKAAMDLAHTDLDAIIRDLGIVRGTNSSIFFVDSGTAGTTGISWATAVADVEAATVLCTTGAGDIIACAPGHAETMTAADDIDLDKIGITLICLGEGDHRATFSYTANGEFVFGADNCAVYNARFIATSDSVVHAIDVEANVDGFKIIGCEFSAETTTVDEFDDVITISTATTRGVIKNNKFLGDVGSNAEPQSCINFNTAHYLEISDNQFFGDRAVACIENAAAANFPLIRDNILFNGIIGGTAGLNTVACISLHASTSALIIDNKLFCNVASPDLAIVAADGVLSGNTYCEAEGTYAGSQPVAGWGKINNLVATSSAMTAGNGYGAADDPTLFTVTGDVMVRCFATVDTSVTSTSNDTVELGVTGDTACLLVQDVVDATALVAGDVWTLTQAGDTPSAEWDGEWVIIATGLDILLTINDHDLTAGVITYYLQWVALSPDGNVTDSVD